MWMNAQLEQRRSARCTTTLYWLHKDDRWYDCSRRQKVALDHAGVPGHNYPEFHRKQGTPSAKGKTVSIYKQLWCNVFMNLQLSTTGRHELTWSWMLGWIRFKSQSQGQDATNTLEFLFCDRRGCSEGAASWIRLSSNPESEQRVSLSGDKRKFFGRFPRSDTFSTHFQLPGKQCHISEAYENGCVTETTAAQRSACAIFNQLASLAAENMDTFGQGTFKIKILDEDGLEIKPNTKHTETEMQRSSS